MSDVTPFVSKSNPTPITQKTRDGLGDARDRNHITDEINQSITVDNITLADPDVVMTLVVIDDTVTRHKISKLFHKGREAPLNPTN